MHEQERRRVLEAVSAGTISVEAALGHLRSEARLGFAQLDLERRHRTAAAEVVYGAGKSAAQIAVLLRTLHGAGQLGLATRVDPDKAREVVQILKDEGDDLAEFSHLEEARMLRWGTPPPPQGRVAVVCAGTSDLPVAAEAAAVLEALGDRVERYDDIGIAGIHRLFSRIEAISSARVVVVVAGMDGALPGVVGGLVSAPVIAVPTSVGYGASFHGLAALLTMLNSCAPGIGVVNIDNGFGAAMLAHRINRAAR